MTIAEQLIQWGRDESADALRQAEEKSAHASAQARADAQAEAQAEKQQIALNLLRNGLDIEFVSQNTKIDIETLNRLLREDAQKAQH